MFRLFRFFFSIMSLGLFWFVGLVGGVLLGVMLMSKQGQTFSKRAESFGRKVVDLAKQEFGPTPSAQTVSSPTAGEFAGTPR